MTFIYCGKHDLTLEGIREQYLPEEEYRISPVSYPSGTSFTGSSCTGLFYVLFGQCELSVPGMKALELSSGEFAKLSKDSSYDFKVIGESKVTIVKVWHLPEIIKSQLSEDK